jgi:hypothetical protein
VRKLDEGRCVRSISGTGTGIWMSVVVGLGLEMEIATEVKKFKNFGYLVRTE